MKKFKQKIKGFKRSSENSLVELVIYCEVEKSWDIIELVADGYDTEDLYIYFIMQKYDYKRNE